MSSRYNPKEIEPKWQKIWADEGLYKAVDFDKSRPKYVVLTEFPYPSGDGLHLGHVREYTLGDIMARYKRMTGHNVLFPMGYDAFGLPTENFAIKNKIAPQLATDQNVGNFQKQFNSLGYSIDWDRSFRTTDPSYYKWTQWLFLQFYKKGLAYQAETSINWCPHCKTGLANEEVVNGRHERCDTLVEKKILKQWLLKITDYADRLIDGLQTVDYPSRIADQQINWIGRSKGAEVDFDLHKVANPNPEMARTYIMGQKNISQEDILSLGGITERVTDNGHLCVEFPVSNAKEFEELIMEKMAPGFWNEYLTNKEVVFIFKHKDNKIERFVLGEHNGHKICMLGNEFNGQPKPSEYETAWQWLENNSWYAPIVPKIRVFTTRSDTLYGATFMVLAPEHPLVTKITTVNQKSAVNTYIKAAQAKSEIERQDTGREKTGVFTGSYAINPVNGSKVPIWIADYVLVGYGTGAIMAVPAHDERDNAFAKKFDIPIQPVVKGLNKNENGCFTGEGTIINSGKYDGMSSSEARELIVKDLESKNLGKAKTTYKLRDWIFSRQHYWGEPIPIIYCKKCGAVPVPDDQLPVELPPVDQYEPTDTGESPLALIESWVNVECPACGGTAKRETDTMPNWAGSSWYYLRYFDAHNAQVFADKKKLKYWGMIDMYLGGMEHTTLHLLYSRFWHQFFYDQGLVPTPEPYFSRRGQGIILASDGNKMSKSKGNVINPTEVIDAGYGADALRLSIAFIAPYDQTTPWNPEGVAGTHRFVSRIWTLVHEFLEHKPTEASDSNKAILVAINQAIARVSKDLHEMSFNTAVSALMEYVNLLYKIKVEDKFQSPEWKLALTTLLQLTAPFAPHITEELWQKISNFKSVHISNWPVHDEKYLTCDVITVVVQINGKLKGRVQVDSGSSQSEVEKLVREDEKIASYLISGVKNVIYVPNKLINFVV